MARKPFVSTLDRLLHIVRKKHKPTLSQQAEVRKHQAVAKVRGDR